MRIVSPRFPTEPHGQGGFTLLEILVGLSISALIMVGLSMMTKTMNLAWIATNGILGNKDQVATGFYVIAGDISRIERMTDKPDDPQQFLFRGGPKEAIYLLAERPAFNQRGLYWIRLFVRSEDAETQLVRMRAPYEGRLQDFSGVGWSDAVVLLRGRYAINFSYRSGHGTATEWTASWDLSNSMPEQMRVEIWDPQSGQLVRPPFIQALRIGAEAACFDPQSTGCTLRSQGQLVAQ